MAKKSEIEKPTEETKPETEKIETTTAESLNSGVIMPTPNERTIAALGADEVSKESETPKPEELDSKGRKFDPTKHAPKKDVLGRWINKNVGRPRKSETATQPKTDASQPVSQVGNAESPVGIPGHPSADRFDLAAELYCRAGYSVLDGAFSANGEWLPESDGEHVALRGAVATYLRHKGTDDLPPALALSLAVATYGAKRISKPNTATKLRIYFVWIRERWSTFRNGRRMENLPVATAPDSEKRPLPPQSLNGEDLHT